MKKLIILLFICTCIFAQKIKYSDFTPQLKADLKDTTSRIVADSSDFIRDEQYQQKQLMNYLYKWRSDIASDQHEDVTPDTNSICGLGDSHMAGLYPSLIYLGQQILGHAGIGFISMQAPDGGALAPYGTVGATLCDFDSTTGWTLYISDGFDNLWYINGYCFISNSNTDTMTWIPNRSVYDTYRIWYAQRPSNAGEFVYKIDGIAVDTIDTQGADSLKYIEESLTVGRHRLTITLETTGTDTVIICGVEFLNTANSGIRGLRLNHGGSYTQQWLENEEYLQQFFAITKPSLILTSLGANDVTFSKSANDFYAELDSLIDSIQVVTDASHILLSAQSQGNVGNYTNDTTQNDSLILQREKLIQLSNEKNIGFWDKYYYLPDWVTASDLGISNYPNDGVHSNLKGRLYTDTELAKILFEGYTDKASASFVIDDGQYNIIGEGKKAYNTYYERDTKYSAGLGWNIFGNMTGDYNIGMGWLAGLNMTGDYNNVFGQSAGRNNSSNYGNFFGYNAGYNNTGLYVNAFGSSNGYNNTGDGLNAYGLSAGYYNTGDYVNLLGRHSGYYNTGNYCDLYNYYSGYYNTGNNVISIGFYSGQYNTGNYNIAIGGLYTGRYNEGTNILIGRSVHNDFIDDTANQKAFANTDVSGDTITITSHGFGSNGSYRLLRFDEGTGVGGMTDDAIYKFEILTANTIKSFGFTIGTPVAGSDTLTPQTQITNSYVFGHNVDPTASYQTTLGDPNVTQAIVYGDLQPETLWSTAIDSITVDADTLKVRVGGQWYGFYEVDAP